MITGSKPSALRMRLGRLRRVITKAVSVVEMQMHPARRLVRDAVGAVRRSGETAVLTLVDGSGIPVGRRSIPDLRRAGRLPEGGGARQGGTEAR